MLPHSRCLALTPPCVPFPPVRPQSSAASLVGLPLVPLADGTFGTFHPNNPAAAAAGGGAFLIADDLESRLFRAAAGSRVVDAASCSAAAGRACASAFESDGAPAADGAGRALLAKLAALAKAGALNLGPVTDDALAGELLPRLLPADWKARCGAPLSATPPPPHLTLHPLCVQRTARWPRE